MTNPWLERWAVNQIGWHEADGNRFLQRFCDWTGRKVLVPLCGKSADLRWLADRGNTVVGVELAELAAEAFFREQSLDCERIDGKLPEYRTLDGRLRIVIGDIFAFEETGFDALFDRAALVALPPEVRPRYVAHLASRLLPRYEQLLVTLEYPPALVKGPPFAVLRDEVNRYYPDLTLLTEENDLPNAPPKFREAKVPYMRELGWQRSA
ncbi:MAG: thiopurine S-methyltransferase [Pseudomonadota bacterium]